jgi:curved DNA-binding protein CbpA
VKVKDILIEALVTTKEEALKILGLKDGSTLDDVKKQYRKMALYSHPDAGGDEEDFKKISAAKEVLDKALYRTLSYNKSSKDDIKKAKEDMKEKLNEAQEVLFKIANKIRQRILEVKGVERLHNSKKWHHVLAKAFVATSGGLSTVIKTVQDFKAINDEINKSESELTKDNLPYNPTETDKKDNVSEAAKQIQGDFNEIDELLNKMQEIDDFLKDITDET